MPYTGLIPTAEPFFFPGSGDPARVRMGCLLVHGFTGAPKEMRWMAKQGYSVLGVRLAGHATRPEDMIRSRWHGAAGWPPGLMDCARHILSGCTDRIYLMGLSMGGMLSLTFAARRPVAGLVIMSTPHHLPSDPRALLSRSACCGPSSSLAASSKIISSRRLSGNT